MHRQSIGISVGLLVVALLPAACSSPSRGPGAPPPPTPREHALKTYDYSHSIQRDGGSGIPRKLVVALVRFADDRELDDVPYGTNPEEQPEENSTSIKVDVQVASIGEDERRKQPLSMSRRSREMLKHELMESESFVLVERERILDILREQKFGETKYVNPDTSPDMGQIMSVQFLLEGSIGVNEDRTLKNTLPDPPSYKDGKASLSKRILEPGKVADRERLRDLYKYRRRLAIQRSMRQENSISVYLSLYDVRTSEIAGEAFGIGGNRLEAIRDAVDDLIDKCRDIPNPVQIAGIRDDRVFLDIGAMDNVQIGDRFRYLTVGQPIRNKAGQTIGRDEAEGGEVEVIRVDRLMSVAKVVQQVAAPVVGARIERID